MLVLILIIGGNSLLMGYGLAVVLGYGPVDGVVRRWMSSLCPWLTENEARTASLSGGTFRSSIGRQGAPKPLAPATAGSKGSVDEAQVELLLWGLKESVQASGEKAAEIDTRLRSLAGQYDIETIEQCAAELLADCEGLLAEQSQSTVRFRDRAAVVGTDRSLVDQNELANIELSAQIETATGQLRSVDRSDPAAAAEGLMGVIHDLRMARNRWRDDLELLFVAIGKHESRLSSIDPRLKTDPLTGLPNRVGLEATLADWWEGGAAGLNPVSAALLDVDCFGQLNKTYGTRAGDEVLRHLGRQLRAAADEHWLVGRYAGQRFLVAARNVDRAGLSEMVQRVQQSLGQGGGRASGEPIPVTVSVEVMEATAGEPADDLLQRLEEALAKQRPGDRSAAAPKAQPVAV